MKPVKLGIIGCGIATNDLHWPALKEMKDKFEIAMVCNHTEEKAKKFAKTAGNVPYVMEYQEMLKDPDIEAVSIVLPIELNYSVTADAVKAGKHVIVEKPIAVNLSEAKLMLEIEKNYPKVLMVAENFRYRKVFQRLKELLDQDKIGTPYAVFWNCFNYIGSDDKYAQTQWRINHKYQGGFVVDGGVHTVAAIRDIFGDIFGISCCTRSVNKAIGEIDTFCLQFNTQKNVQGILNIFFSSNSYSDNRIIVLGTKGSIVIDNNQLFLRTDNNLIGTEKFENDNGYNEEFVDFYNAIRTNRKVKSTFLEAYNDLKVLVDALGSAVNNAY
jgi:predicted dehydrogenase